MGTTGSIRLAMDGSDVGDKIQHVFVLMLENRSFDHVFGRYPGSDTPAKTVNHLDASGWMGRSLSDAAGKAYALASAVAADHVTPDPPHEIEDVYYQLTGLSPWITPRGSYSYNGVPKTNDGFVKAYLETPEIAQLKGVDPVPVIASWTPEQLPVLASLAREYALCDRWFSSMPGPTWPNRLFVHAGHSGGLDYSPGPGDCTERFLLRGYELGTNIFQALPQRAAIYSDGAIPLAFALEGINNSPHSDAPIVPFNRFCDDLAKGVLDDKRYVFIEPNYGKALGTNVTNEYDGGNSQHAVASFQAGEKLVQTVYNSLRNSKLWARSLLVITWDEHGGFFDHEPPPTHPSLVPTGTRDYSKHGFAFDSLGVRVPALLISPYIKPGFIDSATRDHSVIPNFVAHWFSGAPLPQGRQPAPGGVTALSAASDCFDWGLDPAAGRLPQVSMTWGTGLSLWTHQLGSFGRGVKDAVMPAVAISQGEASRTVKSRAVLAGLAQVKAAAGVPGATQAVAAPTLATLQGLKTRAEHLAFIQGKTKA